MIQQRYESLLGHISFIDNFRHELNVPDAILK